MRPKHKHPDLPKYMTAREVGGQLLYYWCRRRRTIALGKDRAIALMRAAELTAAPLHEAIEFAEELPLGMLHNNRGYFYINAGKKVALGKDRLEAVRGYMEVVGRVKGSAYADILSAEEIVKRSQPIVRLRGIYFLVSQRQVVYVGKAIDVHRRLEQHKAAGVAFDAWAFVPCDHDLEALERHYIRVLNPCLNTHFTRRFANQSDQSERGAFGSP